MKSSGGVEKKHVRLREPQHTPVEHSSGIPKAPNEMNSDSRGRWFFCRYVPRVCWKVLRVRDPGTLKSTKFFEWIFG